jgi:hypothetical protein
MRGFVVRRRSSTTTAPRPSSATPRELHPEPLGPRPPTDGDQQCRERQLSGLPAVVDDEVPPSLPRLDPQCTAADVDLDALGGQRRFDHLAGDRLLPRQEPVGLLDQRHRSTEPSEGLPELDPLRTTAEHEQPSRQRTDVPEVVGRERSGNPRAGQRGQEGCHTGRDHRVAEAQRAAVHLQPFVAIPFSSMPRPPDVYGRASVPSPTARSRRRRHVVVGAEPTTTAPNRTEPP